jgi:hypothetical protein
MPSDSITRRRAGYACNMVGRQDAMASTPLKTSFASPSQQGMQGGSTALYSRAAIMPSDSITRRHAGYACNMVGRQDAMASTPLKTSFASPSQQGPIE